jgi:hypothetical protein
MPEYPKQSFKAVKTGMKDFELYALLDPSNVAPGKLVGYDTLEVMDLFSSFEDIRYEAIVDDLEPAVIDSVKKSRPYHILTIETVDGNTNVLKSWHKRGAPDNVDADGNPLFWDPDRMYASINNGQDFVLIQFFVFDRIFRPLDSFFRKKEEPQQP